MLLSAKYPNLLVTLRCPECYLLSCQDKCSDRPEKHPVSKVVSASNRVGSPNPTQPRDYPQSSQHQAGFATKYMNWLAISSRYRTDLGVKPGMNRAVIFIVEEYKTALDRYSSRVFASACINCTEQSLYLSTT